MAAPAPAGRVVVLLCSHLPKPAVWLCCYVRTCPSRPNAAYEMTPHIAPSSSSSATLRGVVGSATADELDAASRDLNGTLSRSTVSAGGDGGGDGGADAAPAAPLGAGGASAKVEMRPGDRGESMALAAAASRSRIGTESSSTPRVCDSDRCRCCTCTTLRTASRIATWASHAMTIRPPRDMAIPTWAVHHGSVRIPLPIIVLIMFAVARPGDDASSAAMAAEGYRSATWRAPDGTTGGNLPRGKADGHRR